MKLFRRSARNRQALDRATLDRMLEGEALAGGPNVPAEAQPVVRVLRAAAAPAHPEELRGEYAARAGYRVARSRSGQAREPKRAAGAGLTRLLSLNALSAKVLAVILGVVAAAGGVALAASSGVLPDVLDPSDSVRSTTAGPPKNTTQRPGGSSSRGGPNTGDVPTPIQDLCSAYLAKDRAERKKALETPEFDPLVQAAEGENKVDNFCEKLSKASRAPGPQRSGPQPPNGGPGQQHSAPGQQNSAPPGQGQPNPAPTDKPPGRRTASPDR